MKSKGKKALWSSVLYTYFFLLCVFFYDTSLKEIKAQNTQRQAEQGPARTKELGKEAPQTKKNAKKKETEKKQVSSKQSDAEKSPLKELDQSIAYPNGLYSGTLSIRFQGAKKESQKYSFRLYLKEKNRLYYFYDNSSRLVYKLLYFQYPQSKLMILGWDPLRELLHRKERMARFQRVLQSAFNYWDLALLPYSPFYRFFKNVKKVQPEEFKDSYARQARQEDSFFARGENKNLPTQEKFPENLSPSPENIVGYMLKANILSPYIRVQAYVQKDKKQVARIDFYAPPGLLKKSLYPSYSNPVYHHAQKKEINLSKVASGFRLLDFDRETLSSLEIKSYDPRASLKPGLFDPRFIKN